MLQYKIDTLSDLKDALYKTGVMSPDHPVEVGLQTVRFENGAVLVVQIYEHKFGNAVSFALAQSIFGDEDP